MRSPVLRAWQRFLLDCKYNRFVAFSLTSLMKIQPSVWTESEMQTLRILMDYSPDILPCDAAIICRKPCREVLHCHLATETQINAHPAADI
jgi:hypothetical protein